jgi:hypothetical protein
MLEREQIIRALARIAELLRARGIEGEICLLGGTVMVLAFKARAATKDVDAVFEPAAAIHEASVLVEREQDLPPDWLNDAAKGFLSARHDAVMGDLPQFEGLRVTAPTAEYMLAMKCMASRIATSGVDPSDVNDITFLIRHLGLDDPERALEIVARYYPEERIPPRARYLLEEIFAGGAPS